MIQQATCPNCRTTVVFPKYELRVACPQCGAMLARKGSTSQPDPDPAPPLDPPTARKRRKKKPKSRQGQKVVGLVIAGIAAFGVLLVGGLIWLLWPGPKPPAAGPDQPEGPSVAVVNPPVRQAPPWKAKADPPIAADFPAEGFIDLNMPGQDVYQSELRGQHVVHLAQPTVEPKNLLVLRVLNLRTGKSIADIPQQFLHCAVSDDGKRLATVVSKAQAGAPKKTPPIKTLEVCELPGLKVLHSLSGYDLKWHDFGKTSDVLVAAFANHHLGVDTVMFADLKAEQPMFKPLPLSRMIGRKGGLAAASPGRSFLAVTGERHVELFDLADGTHAGVLDAPGQVLRCAFSADGKELVVLSATETQPRSNPLLREQTPLQWTTFSMEDGRELRKVEATGALGSPVGPLYLWPDAETVLVTTHLDARLFDVRMGAAYETMKTKLLRPLDRNRLIVYEPDRSRIRLEKVDEARLADRRVAMRGVLGERPEAVTPDTKDARAVSAAGAAWDVPVVPAPAPRGTIQLATSPDPHNEFVFPRADAVSWSVVVGKPEDKPRLRYALSWKKLDLKSGTFGAPIPLWPCAVEPGQVPAGFGYSMLKVDQTAANDKLALRDPRSPGRVDIWDDTGKRLTGFYAHDGKAEVAWLAWAGGDRLLTLAEGTLTGWDGPRAKAVFRASGGYANAFLAPSRKWVAATAKGQIDLYDTETGKPLGRLPLPDASGEWPALGVSPDGGRLLAARTVRGGNPQAQLPGTLEYAVWDLRNGALVRTDKAFGNASLHAGTTLHELSEKQLLLGTAVLDLECNTTVATLALPGEPIAFPLAMHGGRLWFPVGASRSAGSGHVGVMKDLVSKEIPGDLVDFPRVTPGDVVFRPGTRVQVVADLGNAGRSKKAKEQFESALRADGFTLGEGGWKVEISATVRDAGKRLTTSTGSTIAAPVVSGVAKLVSPDGMAVPAGSFGGEFGRRSSKYLVRSEMVGLGGSITHYNFGGRNPRDAMAEEAWEEAMENLAFAVNYPRILAKVEGKLSPLPVVVRVK